MFISCTPISISGKIARDTTVKAAIDRFFRRPSSLLVKGYVRYAKNAATISASNTGLTTNRENMDNKMMILPRMAHSRSFFINEGWCYSHIKLYKLEDGRKGFSNN